MGNNPVLYIDPDGEWIHIAIAAAIGGTFNVVSLDGMKRAAAEAGGSQARFLKLFDLYVKQPVVNNPSLLRKSGWQ